MNLHADALQKFGLDARIAKLREEAIELALACDRYLAGKGPMEDVVAEACDVAMVFASVRIENLDLCASKTQASYEKLEKAVYGAAVEY